MPGMPASVAGDQSMGHGFSPSPITPTGGASAKLLITGKVPHVQNDPVTVHCLGQAAHAGTLLNVSKTVLAGGKGIARVMDTSDCGCTIAGTAGTVLIGG